MRTIPRFYLNESILDDLMNDPDYQSGGMSSSEKMASNVILSSTNNDDYLSVFRFRISGLAKKKKLDWYFKNLRQFQENFIEMMDINRYVRDYNHQLVFAFNKNWKKIDRDIQQVVREENGLLFMCYEDEDVNELLPASGNELDLTIGINAVIEDIFQLRKMMLTLYRIFKNSLAMSFKSQARAFALYYVKNEEREIHGCTITESYYNQWKELPKTFDRSMKEMCCQVFPLKPKEIQKQLDDWRNVRIESGKIKVDKRAIDLLNNLGLYEGRETVNFNESDKSVDIDIKGRKWEPTKLNQLINFIDNYEYTINIKGLYGLHIGFNYVDKHN